MQGCEAHPSPLASWRNTGRSPGRPSWAISKGAIRWVATEAHPCCPLRSAALYDPCLCLLRYGLLGSAPSTESRFRPRTAPQLCPHRNYWIPSIAQPASSATAATLPASRNRAPFHASSYWRSRNCSTGTAPQLLQPQPQQHGAAIAHPGF